MSELKHTPGPWIVKTAINGDRAILSEGIGIVAECFTAIRSFDEKTDEVIGNTAIMAASLELLEAAIDAKQLLDALRMDSGVGEILTDSQRELYQAIDAKISAAIAKAKA